MNTPLGVIAIILWVMLLFLAVRQCKQWGKASRNEKIMHRNHPAIPVKEYKLSEFVVHDEEDDKPKLILTNKLRKSKTNPEKQIERLTTLKNTWDI